METGLIKFIPELTRCFLSMCWIFDSKQQVVTIDLLICGRINSGGWLWFGINRLFSVFPSLLTSLIELKFYIENTLWYILCYGSQYYMLFLVLFILKCYRHTDICISFLYSGLFSLFKHYMYQSFNCHKMRSGDQVWCSYEFTVSFIPVLLSEILFVCWFLLHNFTC